MRNPRFRPWMYSPLTFVKFNEPLIIIIKLTVANDDSDYVDEVVAQMFRKVFIPLDRFTGFLMAVFRSGTQRRHEYE